MIKGGNISRLVPECCARGVSFTLAFAGMPVTDYFALWDVISVYRYGGNEA